MRFKKILSILVYIIVMICSLTGCNWYTAEEYKILEDNYESLQEEYDDLERLYDEAEDMNDFLMDEIENAEENEAELDEYIWEYLIPEFKDGKIREPHEEWNVDNVFRMYIEKTTADGESYCRYAVSNSSFNIDDGFFSIPYDTEEIPFIFLACSTQTGFEWGRPYMICMFPNDGKDEQGFYRDLLLTFSDFETKNVQDAYVDVLISVNGKVHATTFHCKNT